MKQKVLFNKEQCRYLRTFCDKDFVKRTDVPVRGNFNTSVIVIPPSFIPNWFVDSLKFFKIKDIEFQNEFAVSRAAIVNKYSLGGYFARHRDDYAQEDHWTFRYKTLLIQLSDPSSYDGGTLLIDDIPVNKEIGNTIFFDSSTYHELTEITRGERYSLVMWLDRDDIKQPKSLL